MEVDADIFECGVCREPLCIPESLSDGSVHDFECINMWIKKRGGLYSLINHEPLDIDTLFSENIRQVLNQPRRDDEINWDEYLFDCILDSNEEGVFMALKNGANCNEITIQVNGGEMVKISPLEYALEFSDIYVIQAFLDFYQFNPKKFPLLLLYSIKQLILRRRFFTCFGIVFPFIALFVFLFILYTFLLR
jgi:hypothetical protein